MSASLKRIFACLSVFCLVDFSNGSPDNKTTFDQRQTGEYNIQISLKDIRIFALLSGGFGGPEDYDYNYDYSEMTIKPPKVNSTTSAPNPATSSTITPSNASITAPQDNAQSTTERIVEITPATLPTSTKAPVILSNNATKIDLNNATISKNQTASTNNTTVSNNQTLPTSTIHPLTVRPDYSTGIPVHVIVSPLETVPNNVKRGSDGSAVNLEVSETSSALSANNNGTKLRRADCLEGFRKDKQGNCRPRVKKPQQQTLLRKLIQLSKRLQPTRQKNVNNNNDK